MLRICLLPSKALWLIKGEQVWSHRQKHLSLCGRLFSSVRLMHIDLIMHLWKGSQNLVTRERESLFFFFPPFPFPFHFNADKHQRNMKGEKKKKSAVGRWPSHLAMIILHLIHIWTVPRGTRAGNTQRLRSSLSDAWRGAETVTSIGPCFWVH